VSKQRETHTKTKQIQNTWALSLVGHHKGGLEADLKALDGGGGGGEVVCVVRRETNFHTPCVENTNCIRHLDEKMP